MKKVILGISPCPNDTFMFANLLKNPVADFDVRFEDIETLNKMALREETDITKLSYHTWLKLHNKYKLLNSGGALGENCGPVLISRYKAYPDEVPGMHIAIPGKLTTAALLLDIFFPDVKSKTSYVFSEIEDIVMDGECDAGLIIHESRFTYERKGLKKIVDLGSLWEDTYHLPTPLGGIAIHRRVPENIAKKIDKSLQDSIKMANDDPASVMSFVRKYAQSMDDDVIKQHINLYVNRFSPGDEPAVEKSIRKLAELALYRKIITQMPGRIFV
ncbi:MAG: 1,4-dihydroxy-6-naphthoate synthase [Bacteroidota bacterium]